MNNIDISSKESRKRRQTVRHDGVVETIEGSRVTVRIVQMSACASCQIAGHCHASEKKEKVIDIYDVAQSEVYSIGQQVVVCAATTMAARALLYAFGLPLAIIMAVIIISLSLSVGEGMAALLGMVSLIPYYIILYLMRDKLCRRFKFWIE